MNLNESFKNFRPNRYSAFPMLALNAFGRVEMAELAAARLLLTLTQPKAKLVLSSIASPFLMDFPMRWDILTGEVKMHRDNEFYHVHLLCQEEGGARRRTKWVFLPYEFVALERHQEGEAWVLKFPDVFVMDPQHQPGWQAEFVDKVPNTLEGK
jgi:hypothetical protein